MNFKEAKKTFELLKMAYVTGAIDYDELCLKVDTELEVTDAEGNTWKIDEESGEWLLFDAARGEWLEKQPEGLNESIAESPSPNPFVKISPPSIDCLPAEVYNAWKKRPDNSGSSVCRKCGKELKPENKFCTACGEKR